MNSNLCSRLSYEKIKSLGYLGKAQGMYLAIFAENEALTHLEATLKVNHEFQVRMPARNGRIAELEDMGFLKKVDVVECQHTGHKVNRWIWTGRTIPLESKEEWVACDQCEGKGGHMKKVYFEPPKTIPRDMF